MPDHTGWGVLRGGRVGFERRENLDDRARNRGRGQIDLCVDRRRPDRRHGRRHLGRGCELALAALTGLGCLLGAARLWILWLVGPIVHSALVSAPIGAASERADAGSGGREEHQHCQ